MKATGPKNHDPAGLEVDDHTLSAWLDEELESTEARQVQAAVDVQPELQTRLARMMVNDRRLREHYSEMARSRPVPEAMEALLLDDEASPRPWFLRLSDWSVRALPRPALATAAAALALVVGIQLGNLDDDQLGSPDSVLAMTEVDADHAWFELLESSPSGESRSLADGEVGQVALSYRDLDGRWCRQFDVRSLAEGSALAAVACRSEGIWQIGLAQAIPLRQQNREVFHAASGEATPALDEFIMNRMDGDLLLGSAESDVIDQGWR
jgi:hypothetical protein